MVVIGEGTVAPKGEHSRAELVVHDRVPLAAQQPAVGDAPFLAGNVAFFGVDRVHGIAETFPVIIIGVINSARVHVAADVQAPAVGGEHPMTSHGCFGVVLVIPNPGSHFRVAGIELGQGVVAPPGFVSRAARRAVGTHAGTRAGRNIGEVEPFSVK